MGVLAELSEQEGKSLGALTTRMVYTAGASKTSPARRPKGTRRARLAARDQFHQRRDDVRSPASGGQGLRLLPALHLMMRPVEVPEKRVQIGAVDV